MNYKIDISGMHCSGCSNLIKMSLEDIGFDSVQVALKDGYSIFSSEQDSETLKQNLNKVFANFDEYKFSNLSLV